MVLDCAPVVTSCSFWAVSNNHRIKATQNYSGEKGHSTVQRALRIPLTRGLSAATQRNASWTMKTRIRLRKNKSLTSADGLPETPARHRKQCSPSDCLSDEWDEEKSWGRISSRTQGLHLSSGCARIPRFVVRVHLQVTEIRGGERKPRKSATNGWWQKSVQTLASEAYFVVDLLRCNATQRQHNKKSSLKIIDALHTAAASSKWQSKEK